MTFAPSGFWSYAHADNEATDGQVLRLAQKLAAEFRLLTGTDLHLFVDRTSLEWGDEWRTKVDTSIHGTTFFIPVITPTFLQREECRRELLLFQRKSAASDLGELLLPIIFAEIQFDEDSDDEVLSIISKKQGEPFWDIRLEDEQSSGYKKAIHKFARKLQSVSVAVEDKAEKSSIVIYNSVSVDDQIPLDDEPGFLDKIFQTYEIMPLWLKSVEALNTGLDAIGRAFDVAQPMRTRGKAKSNSMGPQIAAIRALSRALEGPTEDFLNAAKHYKTLTAEIGSGIAAIGDMAVLSNDPEEAASALTLANSIEGTFQVLQRSMVQAGPLLDLARNVGRMSRDMRRPTKRITEALTIISDTLAFYSEWIEGLRSIADQQEDA